MITAVRESDSPKSLGERVSEFMSRPPQPILRFKDEPWWEGNTLHFKIRGGLPIPLFYGVYVEANGNYSEKTDHMHPFSTDVWSLTFDRRPSTVKIKLGIVPFEILTDRMEINL